MNPTIAQQLQSLRLRMVETIIPELPANSKFAREQAAFMVMTLGWLLETHEHQYRYEVVENVEYRKLLAEMLERDSTSTAGEEGVAAVRHALSQPGPSEEEAAIPVRSLIEQNRHLKKLATDIYTRFSALSGSLANPARDLFVKVALSQGDRELAFYRGTGFVKSSGELGELLGEKGGGKAKADAH